MKKLTDNLVAVRLLLALMWGIVLIPVAWVVYYSLTNASEVFSLDGTFWHFICAMITSFVLVGGGIVLVGGGVVLAVSVYSRVDKHHKRLVRDRSWRRERAREYLSRR